MDTLRLVPWPLDDEEEVLLDAVPLVTFSVERREKWLAAKQGN